MTVCNMSIEAGARAGLVAPDDTTFAYLEGRDHAPKGDDWEAGGRRLAHAAHRRRRGVGHGRCVIDADDAAAAGQLGHQPRTGRRASTAPCPSPDDFADADDARRRRPRARVHGARRPARRSATSRSTRCSSARCTNSRIEDLRAAAAVLDGPARHRAKRVMVVPGSHAVKAQAEAEGLDRVFRAAGADWREPGCSMCLAMNPDKLAPGERAASTQQPQLRGPPGPGRPHPPGVARRRRGHRRRRPLRHPGGPVR